MGNKQRFGIDYGETFVPIEKLATVKSILVVAAMKGCSVQQMDIHNALFQRKIKKHMLKKQKAPPLIPKSQTSSIPPKTKLINVNPPISSNDILSFANKLGMTYPGPQEELRARIDDILLK